MGWVVTLGDQSVELEDLQAPEGWEQLAKDVWQFEAKGQRYVIVYEYQYVGWWLWWRGQRYPVQVEAEEIYALRQHFKVKQQAVENGHQVTAHMPGLVTQIKVEEGQSVMRGEGVIVLEAMKMENELRAPGDGIVALEVAVGEQVDKGQLLCVIRSDEGSQEAA